MQALELDQNDPVVVDDDTYYNDETIYNDDDDDVLEEAELEADNEPSSAPKRPLPSHHNRRRHHHDLDKDDDRPHNRIHNNNNDLQGLLSSHGDHYDENNNDDTDDGTRDTTLCSHVGNMTIFVPRVWLARTQGWGMIGPHWFGPLTIAVLIVAASMYFVTKSLMEIGYLTATTCTLFAILTMYHLLNTALRDPGIVLLQPATTSSSSSPSSPSSSSASTDHHERARWCEICELFQPPDGVHCPDCNVCVAGFDHHCVWMGTCVGRNNFKHFIRFNLSWLAYLIYAIVWVTFLGPLFVTHSNNSSHDANNNNSPAAANNRQETAVIGNISSGGWDTPTVLMTNGNHRSLRHGPSQEWWIQE